MKKILFNIALLVIAACFSLSCEQQAADVAVSEVKITAPADTLVVGETMTLTVEVLPANANQDYELSLNEDGKSYVQIIDNTTIKGIKAGTAYVTATAKANGVNGSVKIIVKKAPENPENPEDPENPEKPEEPIEDAFEFAVEVDGIDVEINIMPNIDSAYFYVCAQSYLFDGSSEMSTNPRDYATDIINSMIGEGATLSEILYTGDVTVNYSHEDEYPLFHNDYYTVFAIVVKEDPGSVQGWEFGTSTGTTEFKTEARGSYEGEENILTLTSTVTSSTITVNVGTTTDEEYFIACFTDEDYFNEFIMFEDFPCYTDTEIMNTIFNHYNYLTGVDGYQYPNIYCDIQLLQESGDKEIVFEGLQAGTDYTIVAFCYNDKDGSLKPTTPLYMVNTTTLAE